MSGLSLYLIDANIEALLEGYELVNPETGEIIGVEALDALQMAREDKIENTGLYIKKQTALIDAMKNEEKSISERRKVYEGQLEKLKAYLIQSLGGEKFETAKVNIFFKKNPPAAEITDASKLTSEYMREIPAKYEPDKTKIKEALKAGKAVEGAELRQTVSIYVK